MRSVRLVPFFTGVPFLAFVAGIASASGADLYPSPHYALPGSGLAVAAGDLDGDARPELVVVTAAQVVAVLRNEGATGFAAAVSYSPGTLLPPKRVFVADFDGDGKRDVAVVCGHSTAMAVAALKGDGAGGFAPAVVTPLPGGDPRDAAIGDVNQDGRMDVVVAEAALGSFVEIRGAATSTLFLAPVAHGPLFAPRSIAVGDVTGDGAPDVLVSAGSYSLHMFQPSLGYAQWSASFEEFFAAMRLGHLDGDGILDLVAAPENLGNTYVLKGKGVFLPGQFAFGPFLKVGVPWTSGAVDLGDCNGDGRLDAVLGSGSWGEIRVALNLAGSPFLQQIDPGAVTGGGVRGLVAADLDGDGRSDVASVSATTETVNVVRFTTPEGPLPPGYPLSTTVARSVELADVDGDGLADAVTLADYDAVVDVHRSLGDGTFAPAAAVPFPAMTFVNDVAVGDWNADGFADLFVATDAPSATFKFVGSALATGGGAFGPAIVKQVTKALGWNALPGDLDADGDLDVVEFWGGEARVHRGDGAGGLVMEGHQLVAPLTAQYDARLADLDEDGILDLAFTNLQPLGAGIARGTGSGPGSVPFLQAAILPTPAVDSDAINYALDAGDVDGDGRIDLATARFRGGNAGSEVSFHRNLGGLAFAPATYQP